MNREEFKKHKREEFHRKLDERIAKDLEAIKNTNFYNYLIFELGNKGYVIDVFDTYKKGEFEFNEFQDFICERKVQGMSEQEIINEHSKLLTYDIATHKAVIMLDKRILQSMSGFYDNGTLYLLCCNQKIEDFTKFERRNPAITSVFIETLSDDEAIQIYLN